MRLRKIRLIEFITNFNIGGTERQVLNLARGIDPDRFDLHFACFDIKGQFLREVKPEPRGFCECRITSLRNPSTIRKQLKFARYIRRNNIHVVHSYGFYANVFSVPAARLAGAPVVIASVRDTGDPLTRVQRRIQRAVCRLADCVLANSEAIRSNLIAQGYAPEKIVVIRNGIVPPLLEPERNIREEFRIEPAVPLIVVVSRLNRLKGIEYFLQAAARTSAVIDNARFLVVGDGIDPGYRADLEAYARRLGLGGRLVFTGFRLDVGQILSEASISVLPSLSEGLSNAVLESMAMGVPVVATDVGGNPEAVDSGVTGLLVPPANDALLADAMIRFLQDPEFAHRCAAAGKQRVATLFSLTRMVGDTEKLYRSMVAERMRQQGIQEVAHA
jgi:L-malate glycosyltransferase